MKTFQKPLSPEEEQYYLKKWKKGDKAARDILIERNLRLVAHVMKKYAFAEKETDDLLSIGTIGLIKAINTFDPDKSNKLATYAGRCIENEILMYFRTEKKLSREVSLYDPIGTDKEGNEINLLDICEAGDAAVDSELLLKEDIERLYNFCKSALSDRELEIVSMRYGLFDKEPLTQREIARIYGISRSYVSRIEKKALEKLKDCFLNGEKP